MKSEELSVKSRMKLNLICVLFKKEYFFMNRYLTLTKISVK
jgi:hypothetical protein